MVQVVPVPILVILPGDNVTIHPIAGKPLSTMLPVATVHVGWVTVPTVGGVGVSGCGLMVTLTEAVDVHPAAFFTVKVYVPAARSVKV